MRYFTIIAVVLLLLFTGAFVLAERAGWMTPASVRQALESLGASPAGRAGVAAAVVLLLGVDLVLPVPSSLVMTVSGAMLGPVAGCAASFAGAMAAAWLGFGLCRAFGRRAFVRLAGAGEHAAVCRWLERYGAWAILLSRPVPMLTELISCLAGLGTLSWGRFTALSVAGTLPLCALYAYAGARSGQSTAAFAAAVAVALAVPAFGYGWYRLRRRHD